jgi:hypothetical protein
MLRFIKYNLESIGSVEWYPLFSLLIFVVFFILVVLRVTKMSKALVIELSDLPLNDKIDTNIKNHRNQTNCSCH